jgi:hypothetical protein
MSKDTLDFGLTRRRFISRMMPVCSIACFGAGGIHAWTSSKASALIQEKHKFDKEYDRKFTYKNLRFRKWLEFINLAKALEKEIGKEKLIQFLKRATTAKWIAKGQEQASGSPDNSFKTYVNTFRPPNFEDELTHEVVEDSDTAFEIEVKECLSSLVFRKEDAADIGYAYICFGDYAWAEGFNPKIKLVRDKTLMQGHDYCNHRYILIE